LPIPVLAFAVLLVLHERIARRSTLTARAVAFYERALARLDGRWSGTGETGLRFLDPNHPYAGDLDIFGNGSLFQLICAARTSAGEATLASWLLGPSPAEVVLGRQAAVDELRPKLDLREDMALLGEDVRSGLHADALRRWGAGEPVMIGVFARYATVALSILTPLAFLAFLFQKLPLSPFLVGVLLEIALLMQLGPKLTQIFAGAELPASDLRLLADALVRFERERFDTQLLRDLRQHLETDGLPASRQIARLRRIIEYHDWGRNQAFAPIALVLLWHAHLGFAVERWRVRWGRRIADWIQAVGEIEALSSIAGYAAEHPEGVWPELTAAGPLFEGQAITHPLLVAGVRNDLHLGSDMRLLVVSGSNMSGKSTMLRSVGLNVVLAWAGMPVRAKSLRVSSLAVGASMRVQDSIQDGKSRFYAEITRLRQIMDLSSGPVPLLFLLDELLSGTNSHDRRIGAEAIVRSLFDTGAVGLVTTHDLALAAIANRLAPHAANVHFEDHVEDGHISFDYRMRPGVVEKSNALELMRSVGLSI
jgi:MutS-like protein